MHQYICCHCGKEYENEEKCFNKDGSPITNELPCYDCWLRKEENQEEEISKCRTCGKNFSGTNQTIVKDNDGTELFSYCQCESCKFQQEETDLESSEMDSYEGNDGDDEDWTDEFPDQNQF